jgi:hypothetical protein
MLRRLGQYLLVNLDGSGANQTEGLDETGEKLLCGDRTDDLSPTQGRDGQISPTLATAAADAHCSGKPPPTD